MKILLLFSIAIWNIAANAQSWSALGTGTNSSVYTMTSGNSLLYVGGIFTTAGGNSANRIASWNGTTWSSLAGGMNNNVYSLAMYNSNLYAGGTFTTADGNPAYYIAKWNGGTWSPLGAGMYLTTGTPCVYALISSGSALIAAGNFTKADGTPVNNIASYNGTSWSAIGTGLQYGYVYALAFYNGELYAGGSFTTAGGNPANFIAKWSGGAWSALGNGMGGLPITQVHALAVYNNELYVGGNFTTADGIPAKYIAKWNGTTWSSVGTGMDAQVNALAVYNLKLYAGGQFITAGGNAVNYVAEWDGSTWSNLCTGVANSGTGVNVTALSVYSGGLYAGGSHNGACSSASKKIAKWKPVPTINVNGSTTFCQGKSVTLTAITGSAYLWSNGATTQSITATTSGNYSVAITNACCSGTPPTSVSITVNPVPTAGIITSGATTFCYGNNVTLTADNTNFYSWNNGATSQNIIVNTSGNYSVTATNSYGCSAQSSTINVTVISSPTITANGSTTFCQGNSVTLTSSAANTYSWSNGSTNQSIVVSTAGNYWVAITDTCGNDTSSITTVTVNPLPTVTLVLNPDTVCISVPAYTLTGGSPPFGTYSGVGVSLGKFNPNTAGVGLHTITYYYFDSNNCFNKDSAQIYVDLCTDVQSIPNNQSISIFPNPTNGIFTIQSSEKIYGIEIENIIGKKIFSIQINSNESEINLTKQQKGIYFIKLKSLQGIIAKKIIIQ